MKTPFVRRAWMASLAGCMVGAAVSARSAPSFRSDKNYPDLGLSIRVLGYSKPEPLAQCKQFTYKLTRGAETITRTMFDPYELWYASQHTGQWRDKDGNVLILGRPTHLLPAFPDPHVARDDFDQAMLDPANAFDSADPNALTAWVASFAKSPPETPEPLRMQSLNLANAVFFPVKEPVVVVYAFRVKTRQPNGKTAPSDWFCAIVRIADGTPAAKVRKDFETQLLASVAAIPRTGTGSAGGVRPQSLSVAPAGGKTPGASIPDHPSRTAARKSIANAKDWWYAETPEYIFLSDVQSATGRRLIDDLKADMPVLRGAFAQLVPPFSSETDVSVVRIFREPGAYKRYVGEGVGWSAGLWSAMRRELVIQSQGKDKDQTLRIIKHEGFHQYLFYACGMIENAVWFNEGHACFFEAAEIPRKGSVEIPEGPRVVSLLANLEAAARHIPALLRLDHDSFYSGTDAKRDLNYTTAWALIYFLRKGLHPKRHAVYASILDRYREALASTRQSDQATTAAFSGVDMAGLQADFIDFWKRGRNAARHFDPLADKSRPADRRPAAESGKAPAR